MSIVLEKKKCGGQPGPRKLTEAQRASFGKPHIGNTYRKGAVLSEETKKKISDNRKGKGGGKRSPGLCEKLRLAAIRRYQDPNQRRMASERTKIQMQDQGQRAKIREVGLANKGRRHTPEQLAKQVAAQIGKKKTPHTMESRRKISDAKRGELNWCYGGNFTKTRQLIRFLFEYKLWRCDVFRRDNYCCVECGAKNCELHADHIKPLWQIVLENRIDSEAKAKLCNELWDINNGRTLCAACHRKTDTFGFKGVTRRLRKEAMLKFSGVGASPEAPQPGRQFVAQALIETN